MLDKIPGICISKAAANQSIDCLNSFLLIGKDLFVCWPQRENLYLLYVPFYLPVFSGIFFRVIIIF